MFSPDFGPQINSGLFNSVHKLYEEDAVIKIPKITSLLINQTLENIQYALKIHQDMLGEYLPRTEVIPMRGSPLGYIFKQKYINGRRLTTKDCRNNPDIAHDFVSLLAAGENMQEKSKLYFDLYGAEEYAKNIGRLLIKKDLVFGNIILDKSKKLHYIDVGYIRTDRIAIANKILTQLMHNLGGIQ